MLGSFLLSDAMLLIFAARSLLEQEGGCYSWSAFAARSARPRAPFQARRRPVRVHARPRGGDAQRLPNGRRPATIPDNPRLTATSRGSLLIHRLSVCVSLPPSPSHSPPLNQGRSSPSRRRPAALFHHSPLSARQTWHLLRMRSTRRRIPRAPTSRASPHPAEQQRCKTSDVGGRIVAT